MDALKRLTFNRTKYKRMDALQIGEIVHAASEAALNSLDKHFPGKSNGGLGGGFEGELHAFIDGQLERRFGS